MAGFEHSSEHLQCLLYGRYSKAKAIRRWQKRTAEQSLKTQEECDKCMAEFGNFMAECVPVVICWPCAGICFEEDGAGICGCAACLLCMFYGGITTIVSSTCFKSATGLKCGIPVLVIGTLCGMGLCAHHLGYCQGCCTESQESSPSTADTESDAISDAATVTQPGPNASAISTQPQPSQPSTSSSNPSSDSDCESEGS